MAPRLRRLAIKVLLVVALSAVGAGVTASEARADAPLFYSGTLTENYHNFGACFYTIASACSGWNYWQWSGGKISTTNGSDLIALDSGSAIRGNFGYSPGDLDAHR